MFIANGFFFLLQKAIVDRFSLNIHFRFCFCFLCACFMFFINFITRDFLCACNLTRHATQDKMS